MAQWGLVPPRPLFFGKSELLDLNYNILQSVSLKGAHAFNNVSINKTKYIRISIIVAQYC